MPILYDLVCYINYLSSVPTGIQLPICLEIWTHPAKSGAERQERMVCRESINVTRDALVTPALRLGSGHVRSAPL